jgi:hypothetical protein
VQLQLLQLSIVLVLWLWDFLFSELSLEKDVLSWLSVGSSSGAASRIILSSKGYGAWGWLRAYGCGDNSDIVYGKIRAHQNILTGQTQTKRETKLRFKQ